jgi:hypothetical protein
MSHAGYLHRGGRRGGRSKQFWGDPYYDGRPAWRPAPDEKLVALHQSIAATFAVARQVAREGSPEKTAKATALLDEARRSLYRILTDEAQ